MKYQTAAQADIRFHLHQQTNLRAHEAHGPTIIERGDGCFIIDAHGRRLLEGMSGLWCTALGFSEARLVAAAQRQMSKLPYYQNFRGASNYPLIELAEALIGVAPARLSKAVFQTSGSEANDMAFKLAWYYFNSIGLPSKKKIISRWGGYHGTSISAGSATGMSIMHDAFDLPIDRFIKISSPDYYHAALSNETEEAFSSRCADELEKLILDEGPDTIAAFIAEPVMGSAGVLTPPTGYFEKMQTVLSRHGILFIVDEVICGFGRTGNYWGSQTYDLRPDMLTCAKALTSGYFPMSATLITDEIYQAIKASGDKIGVFAHGYTYGGHPVGAAIALETLRIYEDMNLVETVRARMLLFQQRLRRLGDHPLVGQVRCVGLCGAIEIVADRATKASFPTDLSVANRLSDYAREHGAVVRPVGQAIAFAPPLVITDPEIDLLFDIVEKSLLDLETWLHREEGA